MATTVKLNTSYSELFRVCVENNINSLKELSKLFDWSEKSLRPILKHYEQLEGKELFKELSNIKKQRTFKNSKWFENDYEFASDERIDYLDYIAPEYYVTDYGTVLKRVFTTKAQQQSGYYYCKFVEVTQRLYQGGVRPFVIIEGQSYYVDDLIGRHFVKGYKEGNYIYNHNDYNSCYLHYRNLEWVDASDSRLKYAI